MQMRLVREENDSLKHLQTKQENDARAKAEVIQQLKLGLGTVQAQLMALKDSETPELKQKLDGQLVTFWNECKFSLEELSRKGKEEIDSMEAAATQSKSEKEAAEMKLAELELEQANLLESQKTTMRTLQEDLKRERDYVADLEGRLEAKALEVEGQRTTLNTHHEDLLHATQEIEKLQDQAKESSAQWGVEREAMEAQLEEVQAKAKKLDSAHRVPFFLVFFFSLFWTLLS